MAGKNRSNVPSELPEEVLDEIIYGDFEGPLRDFLKELLVRLWIQGEGFSGKRPLGNSGWKYPVYVMLIDEGYVPGKLDEHGYVEHIDHKAVDKLIVDLIVNHPI